MLDQVRLEPKDLMEDGRASSRRDSLCPSAPGSQMPYRRHLTEPFSRVLRVELFGQLSEALETQLRPDAPFGWEGQPTGSRLILSSSPDAETPKLSSSKYTFPFDILPIKL